MAASPPPRPPAPQPARYLQEPGIESHVFEAQHLRVRHAGAL